MNHPYRSPIKLELHGGVRAAEEDGTVEICSKVDPIVLQNDVHFVSDTLINGVKISRGSYLVAGSTFPCRPEERWTGTPETP